MKSVFLLVQRGTGFECFIFAVYETLELAITAKAQALLEEPNREMRVMKWAVIGAPDQKPDEPKIMN